MRSGNTGGLAQHCIFPVLPTSSSALFCIISQCSVTWRYIPILLQVQGIWNEYLVTKDDLSYPNCSELAKHHMLHGSACREFVVYHLPLLWDHPCRNAWHTWLRMMRFAATPEESPCLLKGEYSCDSCFNFFVITLLICPYSCWQSKFFPTQEVLL